MKIVVELIVYLFYSNSWFVASGSSLQNPAWPRGGMHAIE